MKSSDVFPSRKFFFVLFISAMLLALTGCGTPQIVYKEKIVYKPIVIPKSMLKKCDATPPEVTPKAYSQLTWDEKEKVLSKGYATSLTDLKVCSDGFTAIDAYQERQIKIIQESQP